MLLSILLHGYLPVPVGERNLYCWIPQQGENCKLRMSLLCSLIWFFKIPSERFLFDVVTIIIHHSPVVSLFCFMSHNYRSAHKRCEVLAPTLHQVTGVLKEETFSSCCNNTAFDGCHKSLGHYAYFPLAFWCCPSCSLECCCEAQFVSGKVLLAFAAWAPLEDMAYACTERPNASLDGKLCTL